MLKEETHYTTICDCCGVDKTEGVYAAPYITFYRLLGKDICDLCYGKILSIYEEKRIINNENLNEILVDFIPPKRLNLDSNSTFKIK